MYASLKIQSKNSKLIKITKKFVIIKIFFMRLNYSEGLELISNLLKDEVKDIKEFSKKHKLNYNAVINIKNQKESPQYSHLLNRLFIIFGYKSKIIKSVEYILEKKHVKSLTTITHGKKSTTRKSTLRGQRSSKGATGKKTQ
ncbi:MAG: hypothetical protein ACK4K9_10085 [Bacteroidia bacterium]